jgi:hypothetical protein
VQSFVTLSFQLIQVNNMCICMRRKKKEEDDARSSLIIIAALTNSKKAPPPPIQAYGLFRVELSFFDHLDRGARVTCVTMPTA